MNTYDTTVLADSPTINNIVDDLTTLYDLSMITTPIAGLGNTRTTNQLATSAYNVDAVFATGFYAIDGGAVLGTHPIASWYHMEVITQSSQWCTQIAHDLFVALTMWK